MDHQQATQLMAVEMYLLDELTPQERDNFEQHYFDCQDCALDLRATAGFMDAARNEFRLRPVQKPASAPQARSQARSRLTFLRPAVAWSALAASLMVIAYQNVAVYPQLESQVAALRTPEILPALSLVGGNSRGGQTPEVTVAAGQPFLLQLDLPTQDRFSSYTCSLYSASGELSWRVDVSAQITKDTVSIRVPAADRPPGEYTLTVQGNPNGTVADLVRYRFHLKQP